MRDLPRVPVGVGEVGVVAAPLGRLGRFEDGAPAATARASALSTRRGSVTLIASETPRKPVARGRLELGVGGQVVGAVQAEQAAGGAEEAHLARHRR